MEATEYNGFSIYMISHAQWDCNENNWHSFSKRAFWESMWSADMLGSIYLASMVHCCILAECAFPDHSLTIVFKLFYVTSLLYICKYRKGRWISAKLTQMLSFKAGFRKWFCPFCYCRALVPHSHFAISLRLDFQTDWGMPAYRSLPRARR